MNRQLPTLTALVVSLVSLPSAAHHSRAAFDSDRTIEVTGVVTELEWTSPHARLYVRPNDGDETDVWNFELPSPVALLRRGWRRDELEVGDVVTVTGSPARDHTHIANARTITDEDGNSIFAGLAK